jgi:hypothetical protein
VSRLSDYALRKLRNALVALGDAALPQHAARAGRPARREILERLRRGAPRRLSRDAAEMIRAERDSR